LHWKGKDREALHHFENSLRINRHQPTVLSSLGVFYLESGRVGDSLSTLQEALEMDPRLEDAHYNLGNTYLAVGKANEALAQYQRALEIEPDDTQALNNMAWILATWPDSLVRNGVKAVALAERADLLSKRADPTISATLAAAYAEAGRFPDAIRAADRAVRLAVEKENRAQAESIRVQLNAYKAGNAFRDTRFR
jgi:tetratricopeptide (TPR) repeat protein